MNLKEAKFKLNQSQCSGNSSHKKKEAIMSDTTSTKSVAPVNKLKGNAGSKSKDVGSKNKDTAARAKTTPRKKREAKAETKTRVKLAKTSIKKQ